MRLALAPVCQTNILIWAAVIVVLFVLFGAGKRILLVWDSFLETIGVKDTKEALKEVEKTENWQQGSFDKTDINIIKSESKPKKK